MELREALREIKEKQNEYNFLSKEKSRLEEANEIGRASCRERV